MIIISVANPTTRSLINFTIFVASCETFVKNAKVLFSGVTTNHGKNI